MREWLSGLGVTVTADVERAWFAAEERHHTAWREGRVGHAEHRRARLREFWPQLRRPVGDDAALDAQFTDGFLAHYRAAWRGYDDVEVAVAAIEAAGLAVAVLTNGTVTQQNLKVEALGLTGRVGPVVTAEELGTAKPQPAAYLSVCRRLGVDPAAVLHVGDDHALDVLGARAAGLQAVHLDRDGTGPAGEPARIRSLRELPALLG